MSILNKTFALIAAVIICSVAYAQGERDPHFDPVPIPDYTLPDPLTANDGTKITTAEQWKTIRRPEIYKMFAEGVYGVLPPKFETMTFTVENVKKDARDGKATRKEVVINFNGQPDGVKARMLVYVPNDRPEGKKVPAFLGLNFRGNHTITTEPDVTMTDAWVPNEPANGRINNRSTEASRGQGIAPTRWPIDDIIARGYALCTIYMGELAPDSNAEYTKAGVATLFPKKEVKDGTEWKAISMWAWGLSCALDYLQTDPDIDGTKVAVIGHSRLGKTALWAGACDERFALVVSNNSGCGGAALYRRPVGERMKIMQKNFPYWFCDNLFKYVDKENDLPFDMHELIALQAPRPVYVASSEKDIWADPKGEFLSACNAESVYKLFCENPIGDANPPKMPPLDTPVGGIIHYHVRNGGHNITPWDWEQYMNFADKYLK
ncbi:MAG: acetylxylan esterase [Thermoguttaceae bacterium]|nr:acetylxylan esterase [Thermoguttaceae bacterium]